MNEQDSNDQEGTFHGSHFNGAKTNFTSAALLSVQCGGTKSMYRIIKAQWSRNIMRVHNQKCGLA